MATSAEASRKHTVVLGMNHTSSGAELRDTLLFSGTKLATGLEALSGSGRIHEAVILSTCNRIEIYAVVDQLSTARETLMAFLADFHQVPRSSFESHVYYYHCHKAVEHLYRVISSLDSMVVGETQILGQVKEAYGEARHAGNTGTMLNKLFHMSIEAGKRVRTETRIGEGLVSISSVAVELARKILGKLEHRCAMIIGAGQMSKLTAKHLIDAGIKKLYFANRTRERAMDLAGRFGGMPLQLDERSEVLERCDVVVSSTGSPHYILRPEEISSVMAKRKNEALFLIDIAAPRDIDPAVGKLHNVFLYTIDDLNGVTETNTEMRGQELDSAAAIVKEEAAKYFDWYNSLKVLPTLISLRKQFETVCDEELQRHASGIRALPEPAQQLVRQVASALTKKLLDQPSKTLKKMAQREEGIAFADTVADLFDLKVGRGE